MCNERVAKQYHILTHDVPLLAWIRLVEDDVKLAQPERAQDTHFFSSFFYSKLNKEKCVLFITPILLRLIFLIQPTERVRVRASMDQQVGPIRKEIYIDFDP